MLFACAILLGCLVLIPGDNLWRWAHDAILGLFGSWALLWPVLMIYVAVITAMEKPKGSISGKVWMTVVVIVLFCATGFIFGKQDIPDGLNFWEYIVHLYHGKRRDRRRSLLGGLLGLPLVRAAGLVGRQDYRGAAALCGGDGPHRHHPAGVVPHHQAAGGHGQRGH